MNSLVAFWTFVPLSFTVCFCIAQIFPNTTPAKPLPTVILTEEQITALSKSDLNANYFVYLAYDSCVRTIEDNASSNNAEDDILLACNPILASFRI